VWRGATNGAGFLALSNNFETGGDGICSGNEVNLVRSLAAGGIKDTSGYSKVMYAGTDGLGPLAPTGGHIWGSTNVDSAAWFDRTGAINPANSRFPVPPSILPTKLARLHTSRLWDFTWRMFGRPSTAA